MIRLIGPGGAARAQLDLFWQSVLTSTSSISIGTLPAGSEISATTSTERTRRLRARECRGVLLVVHRRDPHPTFLALSSGFMTYASDIHLEYGRIRRELEKRARTFVLLPF